MENIKKFNSFIAINENHGEEIKKGTPLKINDENFHKLWDYAKENGGVMSIPSEKYAKILVDAGYEEKTEEDDEMKKDIAEGNVVNYFYKPIASEPTTPEHDEIGAEKDEIVSDKIDQSMERIPDEDEIDKELEDEHAERRTRKGLKRFKEF